MAGKQLNYWPRLLGVQWNVTIRTDTHRAGRSEWGRRGCEWLCTSSLSLRMYVGIRLHPILCNCCECICARLQLTAALRAEREKWFEDSRYLGTRRARPNPRFAALQRLSTRFRGENL